MHTAMRRPDGQESRRSTPPKITRSVKKLKDGSSDLLSVWNWRMELFSENELSKQVCYSSHWKYTTDMNIPDYCLGSSTACIVNLNSYSGELRAAKYASSLIFRVPCLKCRLYQLGRQRLLHPPLIIHDLLAKTSNTLFQLPKVRVDSI